MFFYNNVSFQIIKTKKCIVIEKNWYIKLKYNHSV